jgi:hypothetical protein
MPKINHALSKRESQQQQTGVTAAGMKGTRKECESLPGKAKNNGRAAATTTAAAATATTAATAATATTPTESHKTTETARTAAEQQTAAGKRRCEAIAGRGIRERGGTSKARTQRKEGRENLIGTSKHAGRRCDGPIQEGGRTRSRRSQTEGYRSS